MTDPKNLNKCCPTNDGNVGKAIHSLSNRIKCLERANSDIENSLDEEKSRAIDVENTLQQHIEEEQNRASTKEEEILLELNEEQTRAENAELALSNKIDENIETERNRATNVETTISSNLNDEIEARKQAITNVINSIPNAQILSDWNLTDSNAKDYIKNKPRTLDGKSAYELAVDNGFEGTEQEWLASLKGSQGIQGEQGETGPQGPKGETGETGLQGPQGLKGDTGEGFSIYRTYRSIADMVDDAANVPEGKFVIITSNAEDPDNAKLYVRGSLYFTFVTDMSGAQGIQGPQGEQGIQGVQGPAGQDGSNGADGHSPVVTASKSGSTTTIYVDGTSIAAIEDGLDGQNGQNGTNGTNGTDGVTPHIDYITGNWFIGSTDTGVHAQGPAGLDGSNGTNGSNGQDGNDGTDGITPTVTVTSISNGHNVAFSYGTGDSRNADFNVMDGNVANQLQADWNLSDNTQADYIKNKPDTSKLLQKPIDANGYTYVEIAGIRWATMNIGAESETDYGLYFQWADTQGYTYLQVASGQKLFGPGKNCVYIEYVNYDSTATKYNSTDNKTTLDLSDDAVHANWGGSWRMPTRAECEALASAVNTSWTSNYNNSGIAGHICIDKTDSSKMLFFPAGGYATNLTYTTNSNNISAFETQCCYWTSDLDPETVHAALDFGGNHYGVGIGASAREAGLLIRGVLDINTDLLAKVATTGSYNDLTDKPTIPSAPDLTNYVQKSSTSGLLKNDGTVDTNTYLTSHLDISGKANTTDLAAVATSGSYTDLSNTPTIPDAQIQSDWNLTDTSSKDYIKNKPTLPQTGKFLETKEPVYVDLGLTSGTLWATMNVGASTKSGIGNYYMWGKGDKTYDRGDSINNASSLTSSTDTATQVFGSNWSTPTKYQWQELIDECTWTWGTVDGVYGCTVTKNNKSIFLPAGGRYSLSLGLDEVSTYGYYWSSTNTSNNSILYARALKFGYPNDSLSVGADYGDLRSDGKLIRPVTTSASNIAPSKVAISGLYDDLANKPQVPTFTYELAPNNSSDFQQLTVGDGGNNVRPCRGSIVMYNSLGKSCLLYMDDSCTTDAQLSFSGGYGTVLTSENYKTGYSIATVWRGTQSQYNNLASYDDNTIYIITSAS